MSQVIETRVKMDTRKPKSRTRTATGKALLEGVDGRTHLARRYGELLDGLVVEYGVVAESDMHRAREAAHLSLWLEQEAAKTTVASPPTSS